MRSVLLLVAAVAVPSAQMAAQQPGFVHPGDQVRITAPGVFTYSGAVTVVAVRADSLLIRRDADRWIIPRAAITRMERRGKSKAALGAVTGFFAGALVGGFVGGATYEECVPSGGLFDCLGDLGPGVNILGGALFVGALGAGIGALAGASSAGWSDVPVDGVKPTVIAQPGGYGLALTIRF